MCKVVMISRSTMGHQYYGATQGVRVCGEHGIDLPYGSLEEKCWVGKLEERLDRIEKLIGSKDWLERQEG